MNVFLSPALVTLGWALMIFFLRLVNMSLDTIRILAVLRGRKAASWITGFFQVLIYLFIISWVLNDMANLGKFIAFCAGFATGSAFGMFIEERIGMGFSDMRIISAGHGPALTQVLRAAGYAVTEMAGYGKSGTVEVLGCTINRSKISELTSMINIVDPQAFISSEEVRTVKGGYWGF
jgi:uncharacterized protein YebE (UPF0316 family)